MIDSSKQNLIENGFRWHSATSDMETDNYIYAFPLVKHKKHYCIICEVIVTKGSGEVLFNVYDNNHNTYFPFYNDFFVHNYMKKRLNRKIREEFKKLGIVKVDDGENN